MPGALHAQHMSVVSAVRLPSLLALFVARRLEPQLLVDLPHLLLEILVLLIGGKLTLGILRTVQLTVDHAQPVVSGLVGRVGSNYALQQRRRGVRIILLRIYPSHPKQSIRIVRHQRQRLLVVSGSSIKISLISSDIAKPGNRLLVRTIRRNRQLVLLLRLRALLQFGRGMQSFSQLIVNPRQLG